MAAELACVVISFRGREDCVRAVGSLVRQDPAPEVVVVNSGGNSPARRLRDAELDVAVIDVERPLTPGGARNAGVAGTRAPVVSFLAADCWAAPGWAAARLREHGSGADAVAARIVNPYPRSACACGFHLAVHGRRMAPGARALGLSYRREWLERTGLFRDTTLCGEDNEMRRRLGPGARIAHPPDVVTFHDHPTELAELTRDMLERGRRLAEETRAGGRPPGHPPPLLYVADHVAGAFGAVLRGTATIRRRELALGLPLALPAAAAVALGAVIPRGAAAAPRPQTSTRHAGA